MQCSRTYCVRTEPAYFNTHQCALNLRASIRYEGNLPISLSTNLKKMKERKRKKWWAFGLPLCLIRQIIGERVIFRSGGLWIGGILPPFMPDTPLFELAVKSPAGCGDRNDRYPRVAIDRNKPPGSQRSQRSQPALLCDRCDRRSDHTQTQNKHTIPHTEQTHGPPTVLRASWLCCCIRLAI